MVSWMRVSSVPLQQPNVHWFVRAKAQPSIKESDFHCQSSTCETESRLPSTRQTSPHWRKSSRKPCLERHMTQKENLRAPSLFSLKRRPENHLTAVFNYLRGKEKDRARPFLKLFSKRLRGNELPAVTRKKIHWCIREKCFHNKGGETLAQSVVESPWSIQNMIGQGSVQLSLTLRFDLEDSRGPF